MRVLSFVGFLLLVVGCSTTPKIVRTPTGLMAQDFWKEQKARRGETSPISGKLRLHYKAKKQSLSGRGRLVAELPHRVRLELRDPLGRLAYSVALDGNKVAAWYPTQKRAFLDEKAGTLYFKEVFGMEVSFRDLQEVFVGLVPGGKTDFDKWDWDSDRGMYRGTAKTDGGLLTAWIDGDRAILREIQIEVASDTVRVIYGDFESCCGAIGRLKGNTNVPVAQAVAVELVGKGTGIEVQWEDISKLTSPPAAEAFRLTIPDDHQKLLLK